jgi:hypothetical protein
MASPRPVGFWVLVGIGIFICVTLPIGQTMAVINYDFAVWLGMQEPASALTEIGVAINKGFGAADTLVYLPLFVLGLVGYWRAKSWGLIPLSAALGITAYWPVVCLYFLYVAKDAPGFAAQNYARYMIILVPIFLYALWALAFLHRSEFGRHRPQ